jgi:hypothetical protein
MPIDPKKFKKIVNNHFDNLSEEEFLETLHKSSPYLFDGSSEAKHDVPSSDRDEIISQNILSYISDLKSRWDRIDAENYKEFVSNIANEAHQMELNSTDIVTIRIYIVKQKLSYKFANIIQTAKFLTGIITEVITKKA